MQWVDNTGNGPYYGLPTPWAHLGRTTPRPGWTAQPCAKAQSMYWSGNHKARARQGYARPERWLSSHQGSTWLSGGRAKHVRSATWTPSVMHDISYQKPLRVCLAQTWGATSDSLWSLRNKPAVSSFGFYTHLSLRESNLGIKVPSGQSRSVGANRFPVSQTEPRKTKERAFGSYPRNPKGGERITNATKYILGRA